MTSERSLATASTLRDQMSYVEPAYPTQPTTAAPETTTLVGSMAADVGAVALESVENPADQAAAAVGETATYGFVEIADADAPPQEVHGIGLVYTRNGEDMVLRDGSRDSMGALPAYAA